LSVLLTTIPSLKKKVTFWSAEIARDILDGTSQEKVKEWCAIRKIKFDYLEKQHLLNTNIESITVSGIAFHCSEWNIFLKVTLDFNGRTASNNVSTAGSCV